MLASGSVYAIVIIVIALSLSVLIGVWAFFWRVEAQKSRTNRFQVFIYLVLSYLVVFCLISSDPILDYLWILHPIPWWLGR